MFPSYNLSLPDFVLQQIFLVNTIPISELEAVQLRKNNWEILLNSDYTAIVGNDLEISAIVIECFV